MPENKSEPAPVVHAGLSIDRNMIDFLEGDAALAQAVIDRVCRQAGPVFDASKAFLLRRRYELAILDQTGRGIAVISVKPKNGHLMKVGSRKCEVGNGDAIGKFFYFLIPNFSDVRPAFSKRRQFGAVFKNHPNQREHYPNPGNEHSGLGEQPEQPA